MTNRRTTSDWKWIDRTTGEEVNITSIHAVGKFTAAFLARIEKTKTCWLWRGPIDIAGGGYGLAHWPPKGASDRAHRISYRLFIGPIPEEYDVHHECHNPPCVNPEHLKALTKHDNRIDQNHGPSVTECPSGHQYDEITTYWWKGDTYKRCRYCIYARCTTARGGTPKDFDRWYVMQLNRKNSKPS